MSWTSGYQAVTLGLAREKANPWCWRRDRIPQCRRESWCCTADSAPFGLWEICHWLVLEKSAAAVFWINISCCQWGTSKAKMPLILSFKSSFRCCLGPQVALRCPLSIQRRVCVCQLHGCHFASSAIPSGKDCFSFGMCDLCFHAQWKWNTLCTNGSSFSPWSSFIPSHSGFSICFWEDFFLWLPSASFRRSSSHLCFLQYFCKFSF